MTATQELQDLPVEEIEPNPSQPRRYFDEATLQELAGSLKERGVLQPVLVRPSADSRYELIVGERRWRAAKIAGLQTIPALVSSYDDLEALAAALIENIAREDLNPVEEARAYVTLAREFGLTQQQIGDRLGRSRAGITNLTRILGLSEGILALVERGELSAGHARALLSVKDPLVRSQLANAAIEGEWTMRVLENRARESNMDGGLHSPQQKTSGQAQDMTALNIARVWGDALGTEVHVRTLPHHKLQVELPFDTPQAALAQGERITQAISARSAQW